VCRGTGRAGSRASLTSGLSPRVRGNLGAHLDRLDMPGSIPACAGEPRTRHDILVTFWVYPRVCGGTPRRFSSLVPRAGLSPRVRGNPTFHRALRLCFGSIPACAGEPKGDPAPASGTRVYPRVCGGTDIELRPPVSSVGLSPRVRGNQALLTDDRGHLGSIPACAGEPARSRGWRARFGVYPRVCGRTRFKRIDPLKQTGLSPRVRGNPCQGCHCFSS